MTGVFYLQSFYSIKQSVNSVESLVKKAKENQYDFVALSDFENLYGMLELVSVCEKYKIKPLVGMKIRVTVNMFSRNILIGLLVYASNDIGINNLTKISNIIQINGKITLSEINNLQDGIFAILSNIDLIFCDMLKQKWLDLPEEEVLVTEVLKHFQIYLKCFFFGLSLQSYLLEYSANLFLLIVSKLNIKVVITHKTNYLELKEKKVYELLKQLSKSNSLKNEDLSVQFLDKEQIFLKYKPFLDIYQKNFLDLKTFLDSVTYNHVFSKQLHLPSFNSFERQKSFQYLKRIVFLFLSFYKKTHKISFDLYNRQLEKELHLIEQMNCVDYFLIVADLVNYSKKKGILLGPGRGSSVSSLVCFCLQITEVDPLKYNLLFERFLNDQKKTIPDIDLDFPDDKIDIIIKYIINKYGVDYVANLITFNTYSIKTLMSDLNHDFNESLYNDISNIVKGIPRFVGTHPSGIVITNKHLLHNYPIQLNHSHSSILYQVRFDHSQLSRIGLMKMDLLNLKSLSVIEKILKNIDQTQQISWHQISLNDAKTYHTLQTGDTDYIFQLESDTAKNILKKIRPQTIEDLADVLSFNRPGPKKFIDLYCTNKQKLKKNFIHFDFDFILQKTYGILLYQEQIMEMIYHFAGYNLAESEFFMKRMIKNQKTYLNENELKKEFIYNSVKIQKHSPELSSQVYDYISKFSNYTFNKSHAIAYAIISYKMAYLKTHYFLFFGLVFLDEYKKDSQKTSELLIKIKKEVCLLKPNILQSEANYKLWEGKLLLPLTLISGISEDICLTIIKEREKQKFYDFYDFKQRVKHILNNNLLENLIFAGALDIFGLSRETLICHSKFEYLIHENLLSLFPKKNRNIDLQNLQKFLKTKHLIVFGFDLDAIVA
ncbi:PHP domain-containing protein [Candidatus Phytoplasma melaleucae]|uniref:DNA-directed DNA polymerase n=1 Tax=Candidatus Phytoplasma melaleucae TaxID=2982630 RepID=A0ABT9DDN3_9MOLU|nr:PHP domain-containing protein ['Melaleuca sp.' phytoplasma]MDO8168148.1 PHP domain-containing protein ['Melaleuca sp.' phytoplasma]MDV3205224.1 PHP domain-containing protein [Weeping tea tree witches'-broom phytoplasma]